MIQDILVWIIIGATVIYVVYSTIQSIKKKKSCSGNTCAGCSLKSHVQDVRFRTSSVTKPFTN